VLLVQVQVWYCFCWSSVAYSRNYTLEPRLMQMTILGFALTEAMGLLAIMMAFLILTLN